MITLMNPIECKANYAFSVNFITPYGDFAKQVFLGVKFSTKPFVCNCLGHFLLDNFPVYGIIKFTQRA